MAITLSDQDDIQELQPICSSSFKILHASYVFEFTNEGLINAAVDCNELSNSFEFHGASWILGIISTPIESTDDLSLKIFIVKRRSRRILSKIRWRLSLLDENKEKKKTKEGEMCNAQYQFERVLIETKRDLQAMGLLTNDSIVISLELTVTDTFPDRASLNDRQDQRHELRSLSNDFLSLFGRAEDSDFTLEVGEKKFYVHKLILSARSSYFNAMITHEMQEKRNNRAVIKGVTPTDMQYLLTYIYSGTIPDLPFEGLCDLFAVSDMYRVVELKRQCMDQMIPLLTKCNVWKALDVAEKCDKMLMDVSVDFIMSYPRLMLGNKWKEFNKIHPKLSIDILNEYIARTVVPDFISIAGENEE